MRKYLFGLAVLRMVGIVSGFPGSVEVVDRIATVDSPADFNVQVQNNFSSQKDSE